MTKSIGAIELSQFERGRIIGLLEAGISQTKVALKVNRSRNAVQRVWKRWLETGKNEAMPRSGRPRNSTLRDDRRLMKVIRLNRMSSYKSIST